MLVGEGEGDGDGDGDGLDVAEGVGLLRFFGPESFLRPFFFCQLPRFVGTGERSNPTIRHLYCCEFLVTYTDPALGATGAHPVHFCTAAISLPVIEDQADFIPVREGGLVCVARRRGRSLFANSL